MGWYAKRELYDEDWKTQLAKNYGNIPAGAKVTLEGMMCNFYGTFAEVRYNGRHYYVKSSELEYRTEQEESK